MWVGNLNTIPAGGKKMQRPPFPKDEGRGTLPTEATLRVKLEKNHPQGGVGERRGISVGAADYDEDNSCAELADRDMEMLLAWDSCLYLHHLLFACFISSVVHPGKDVCGFYPGQLRLVHKAHASRGAPGKLQPAPINHEAETSFQPHLDNSALKNYYIFKKTTKNQTTHQQPVNQSSYKAPFDLPYLNTSHESKYTPTDPRPHIIWTSTGRKMFSTFQACTSVEESKKNLSST
ncbi:LOW QUALITY PROTEIN: uncharacterized protein C1orf100 homolog [Accipiter gentilis]|uniref:LOW QUALITY PROTEIN: uncharacterized protein C1orf100 homolog n=1 Tax=Astur gentilis TaxID=8957 RepID=UPI00210F3C8F|nr:LOW QUALITY PROTEIN: uncharacterized protein C1orf100 homolog [Accipiter gentilis]